MLELNFFEFSLKGFQLGLFFHKFDFELSYYDNSLQIIEIICRLPF
jgi:hypothetical protein